MRGGSQVAAIALVVAVATGCARVTGASPLRDVRPGATSFHAIRVGPVTRTFLVHVAPRLATPAPLFFVLHGTSANANTVMDESGMNAVADSMGAVVVYPNGTGGIPEFRLYWNVNGCCGRSEPNEAAMVRAIVDSLSAYVPVDRSRIGLAGFSDAGTLAYRIACADANLLTAIAVIAAEAPSECSPDPAVSTLVFHGTADRNLRYGRTRENVAEWAARLGCAPRTTDSTRDLLHDRYDHCRNDADVELFTIEGGRHAWPGGQGSWLLAPRPSRAIDASRTFARFVMEHARAAH